MSEDVISYKPTEGLTYDPSESAYWDSAMLELEITRVFEVCHGCRMCFKYCDSFPLLFQALDEQHDGDVRALTDEDVTGVMDACFQCKLCEVQCPYTPRDGHEFQLDFPRLVHRFKAIRAKSRGLSLRDRLFANPVGVGRIARLTLGLTNLMNRLPLHRWFMEKILGIHQRKQLPHYAGTSFDRWARGHGLDAVKTGSETVIFPTCYVNNNDPQIGRDTVDVYRANQIEVQCATGGGCCGMPSWEAGDLEGLRRHASGVLDRLSPHVEAGSKIVVLQPTCAMMLRREYPDLLEDPRASPLAQAVVDPGEYLWSIRKEARFSTAFLSQPPGGTIAYHAPCHLRAQAVGFRGRDLLKMIGETEVRTVMECCGHDGTHAMKLEGFEASARVGQPAFDGMVGAEAEIWASECALAGLQFEQHAGRRSMHPMSVLARAYRAEGFAAEPVLRGGTS